MGQPPMVLEESVQVSNYCLYDPSQPDPKTEFFHNLAESKDVNLKRSRVMVKPMNLH